MHKICSQIALVQLCGIALKKNPAPVLPTPERDMGYRYNSTCISPPISPYFFTVRKGLFYAKKAEEYRAASEVSARTGGLRDADRFSQRLKRFMSIKRAATTAGKP